jgi:hypothetical protein
MSMRKIKEVLRLRFELRLGQREIARACSISQGAVHNYLIGYHNSHVAWLLYPIDCANLLINTILLVASALCWKLQRKRLPLLSCALVTEVIFVNLILAMGASEGFSKPAGSIVGRALIPFIPQAITLFPIVAGILVFFTYRNIAKTAYARQIATDWNTRNEKSGFAGYVTAFELDGSY